MTGAARPMAVLTTPAEMQRWSDRQRIEGRRIGFVPTMGALHEGHLALITEAGRHADVVVVSIFVNPLQFDVASDFDRYPRPIDDDLDTCRHARADAVYAPTPADMYPSGFQTHVEPGRLAERLEGAHRPGHFCGVTTVVTKLFAAVRPHVAVFGQKDAQQLAIIRRMTLDLDLGIEIVGMPTVREHDGVAMSSRNRRLEPAQRNAATCIVDGLRTAERAVHDGETEVALLAAAVSAPILGEPLARLEYVNIVDPDTLVPLGHVTDEALVLVAVWFGEIRLIDNVRLSRQAPRR